MIEAGVKLETQDRSLLFYCLVNPKVSKAVLDCLELHVPSFYHRADDTNYLFMALKGGHSFDVVEHMVYNYPFDVNHVMNGLTALHVAASSVSVSPAIIKLLL